MPLRVLFLCTGNSARSQLAEALLTEIGARELPGGFVAFSAGTQPAGVNPYTVRVLDEIGIDWRAARSKPLADLVDQPFDTVITVCDRARQACPVFPGAPRTLHWNLEDPAAVEGDDATRLAAFRATREDLARRIAAFVAEFASGTAAT